MILVPNRELIAVEQKIASHLVHVPLHAAQVRPVVDKGEDDAYAVLAGL